MEYKNIICSNSNIQEVWCRITGLPDKFQQEEVGAFNVNAKKSFENLEDIPTFSMVPSGGTGPVQPFWLNQKKYQVKEHQYVSRYGHNYISIHYVQDSTKNIYTGFTNTLFPEIKKWLKLGSESLISPETRPVSQIQLGYINKFDFPYDGAFDIGEYVKVDYGLDLDDQVIDLNSLNVTYNMTDKKSKHNYIVTINGDASLPNRVVFFTEVSATINLTGLHFSDTEKLLREVGAVKDSAKELFFRLITDHAKNYLGVKNVSSKKSKSPTTKSAAKKNKKV